MTWEDRLRQAAYTGPDGVRLTFGYEDVRTTLTKATTAYRAPGANGSYVADLGVVDRQFPMRLFFSGADCDLLAEQFLSALSQRGDGVLEHPIYGTFNVVPFGTITRRDDLATAANQAVLELIFFSTVGAIYPSSQTSPVDDVRNAVEGFNDVSAEVFADNIDLTDPTAAASLRGDVLENIGAVKDSLQTVANTSDAVRREFTAIERSIINTLDDTAGQALVLGAQVALFVESPGRATARIASRLDAYRALAAVITDTTPTPALGPEVGNKFRLDDLTASSALMGSVVSCVNTEFNTKDDALSAAAVVLTQLDAVTAWRDASFDALGEVDTGETYQQAQQAAALCAGFLVDISFTLKQERVITTDRPRTVLDIVAELYGRVDSEVDFFITSNNLTGSEILEIPKGRRLVYYI